MKKQIGVLTATRAEFGLLKPLILGLLKEDYCETKVLVTGMHLSELFGYTVREIEDSKIPIAAKIECISAVDTPKDISNNMATALSGFGEFFANNHLDLLIVLGDRYETLAVCIAAMNARIPIAHIHGGETTEGAVDEAIRHSITKMSYLHFVATDVYRKRVIQLGEAPDRVFNVGALGVENVRNTDFLTKDELEKELNIDLDRKYGVVTFHPVTLESNSGVSQIDTLFKALDEFSEMSFIITKANADAGGKIINDKIDEYAYTRKNTVAVTSLGVRRYLSAVKASAVVIGNSSSGITEAPCFHVPTVNIGDRQRGRIMPESVICCEADCNAIVDAIRKATSEEFRTYISDMANPFGNGDTSSRILDIIRELFRGNRKIDISKSFYDLDINV